MQKPRLLSDEIGKIYYKIPIEDRVIFDELIDAETPIYDLSDALAKIKRVKEIKKSITLYAKMKAEIKETKSGDFLKPSDIGERVGDRKTAIINVVDESTGETVKLLDDNFNKGKKKEHLNLDVAGQDDDKDFALSPTNWNLLIEYYGDETEKWAGKQLELVLIPNPAQKDKLCIAVARPEKKK